MKHRCDEQQFEVDEEKKMTINVTSDSVRTERLAIILFIEHFLQPREILTRKCPQKLR